MTNLNQTISEALETAGKSFKQTKRSFVTDCPACGKEDKCYILKESGRGICFKCGAKWNSKGILAAILGITRQEADQRLRGYADEKLESLTLDFFKTELSEELTDDDFETEAVDKTYKAYFFDITFIDVDKSERAVEYLSKRGVTDPSVWKRHNLKYQAGLDAIIAPVTMFGTHIGYQARFIQPKNKNFRMKTSDGLPRERALLNYDSASLMDSVIIVEGIFDCLKTDLQSEGIGSIATMGKVLSEGQIKLIQNMPARKIYLALDRDAYDIVPEICSKLNKTKEVYRLLPPQHRKDFGDCTKEEILEAVRNSEVCHDQKVTGIELYIK